MIACNRARSAEEHHEAELADEAVRALTAILGAGWEVRTRPAHDLGVNFVLTLLGPDRRSEALMAVEVKRNITPSMVTNNLPSRLERSRQLLGGKAIAVVVSEWLSPRTRQMLDAEEISYLDTTGNVSLRVPEPAMFIRLEGQQRDPRPRSHEVRRGISGPRAGRLVRQLVDFQPPPARC